MCSKNKQIATTESVQLEQSEQQQKIIQSFRLCDVPSLARTHEYSVGEKHRWITIVHAMSDWTKAMLFRPQYEPYVSTSVRRWLSKRENSFGTRHIDAVLTICWNNRKKRERTREKKYLILHKFTLTCAHRERKNIAIAASKITLNTTPSSRGWRVKKKTTTAKSTN